MLGLLIHAGRALSAPLTARWAAQHCCSATDSTQHPLGRPSTAQQLSRNPAIHASSLPAPAAETYTAHSTAIPAVQFNKVYLTPCKAVPSISFATASDKRCSLGVKDHRMSHKRTDQITVSGEWARHLRPYGKRAFWKAERRAYAAYATGAAAGTEYHHADMPTKVQELIARLEADGWFQVRQKGSHRQFHHPSRPGTVTVAGKSSVEVPPGTLNSILKQAGLKK